MDGFVTRMEVDVVNAKGKQVPIDRLMLHHVVFHNFGARLGAKRDQTCSRFTMLDSTIIPAVSERFYGAGEERQQLVLPPGYGYRTSKQDNWMMTWMLMNHRAETDSAYIQYKVTLTDDPATTPVTPYWGDVENCNRSSRSPAAAPPVRRRPRRSPGTRRATCGSWPPAGTSTAVRTTRSTPSTRSNRCSTSPGPSS